MAILSQIYTDQGIRIGSELICGCCGAYFRVWPAYRDQDQDRGYGICEKCQSYIGAKNRRDFDAGISLLAEGLSENNRAQFLSYSREAQEMLVVEAIKDGIIEWRIGYRER